MTHTTNPLLLLCSRGAHTAAEIIGKHYFSGKSTQDAINMQTVWWPGNKVSMGGEFQLRGSAAFHPVKQ
eukprot:CAMPEP_0114145968 /NCGR_PEP_ID=MMETSP0043_2-20121206/20321_1 /TAXON_ID=464988 /ORGANISM="Hemiselmis andersenii, Strain CCMP644" /LENGTH=68 /DNA_ID=CAMNT_0001240405 /DNA_START=192 /DNA_END=397 /DNA_ORIENTATION=-